jgi:hypothetical protein
MTKKELIGCIVGVVGLISVSFGVYFFFENRYAHASDMTKAMESIKKLAIRLDYKIIEDQLHAVQQRIWTIEDRYCPDKSKPCDESKMPQTVREQYRELKCEKEKLQNDLKTLNKEVVK